MVAEVMPVSRNEREEYAVDDSGFIEITDRNGRMLLPQEDRYEPECASVVLVNGEFGSAYQRFFSDGRWHQVNGGRSITWKKLCEKPGLVLVYDAAQRDENGRAVA